MPTEEHVPAIEPTLEPQFWSGNEQLTIGRTDLTYNTTFPGNLEINGDLEVRGNLVVRGDITCEGDLTVGTSLNMTGGSTAFAAPNRTSEGSIDTAEPVTKEPEPELTRYDILRGKMNA